MEGFPNGCFSFIFLEGVNTKDIAVKGKFAAGKWVLNVESYTLLRKIYPAACGRVVDSPKKTWICFSA